MKRIDNTGNTGILPTYATGPETPGYFTDGTPGVADGTIPGQDWFNQTQEELVNAIEVDGATLDGAADDQLAGVIEPSVKAVDSDVSDTGSVTNTNKRVVVGSATTQASGDKSFAAASTGMTLSGDHTASLASTGGDVDADVAAMLGCTSTDLTAGARAAAIGCDGCEVELAAGDAEQGVLVASQNARLGTAHSLAGGYSAVALGAGSTDTNLQWRLDSVLGTLHYNGTLSFATADYAEMFENSVPGSIDVARLVCLDGDRVRVAEPGDVMVYPVSANPGVIGNDSPLNWAGKYEYDEFGTPVLGPDGGQKVSPNWDPTKSYTRRSERPDGWTCVAMLGQTAVRCDETVQAGDYIAPGADGIGTRSETPTTLYAMKVSHGYDADRGCAIVKTLVG